jgi:hypothetical protein
VYTASAAFQVLLVFDPVVGIGYRGVRHTEHPALKLQRIPEEFVGTLQPDGCTGFAVDFTGSEDMIEMGVGVDDADDLQTHGLDGRHDTVGIAARVKYITDTRFCVTQDGAVAL